ncbi:hypothetical protein Hanom_Chr13g01227381 [Helianthus anomalus]
MKFSHWIPSSFFEILYNRWSFSHSCLSFLVRWFLRLPHHFIIIIMIILNLYFFSI